MSNPLDQAPRAHVLKGTQAQALSSIVIEPRPARRAYSAPELDEHEPDSDGLRELHDSLSREDEAQSAELQAGRILAEAHAQRESLLAGASQQAEQQRQQMERELAAMQEAAELELAEQRAQLIDGIRRDIEQEYAERYARALEQLEQAGQRLAEERERFVAGLEQPALELVLCIARQLLGQELSRSPQFLAGLIAQALDQLRPRAAAQLALHPDTLDLLLCDDLLAGCLAELGWNMEAVELRPSPALALDQFELQAGQALIRFDLQQRAAELVASVLEQGSAEAAAGAAG